MPFVTVPNTVMAEMRMTLDDQRIENTLYFFSGTGVTIPVMTDIGNQLLAWWSAEYAAPLCSVLKLREIYLTDLSSSTGPTLTIPAPTPVPQGGSGEAPLPSNCAFCVSFRANKRGRAYRGRNYVSGLPETAVVFNTVSPATVANIKEAYEGLFTRAASASVVWVVVSRFYAGDPRLVGNAEPIASVVIVDDIIDSQRRRLPGRGR